MSHADYLKPWVETGDLRERLDSIVTVIRLIQDEELHDDIARRLYKEMTWEATELGGKYSTRYRSVKALELQKTLPVGQWKKQVAHEHVFPRKHLRERLSRCHSDHEIRQVLWAAQGCVIRRDEHALLDETQTGWRRYLGRIEVVDMRDGNPADLQALANESD
jgi:rubrerythrin